MRLLLLFLFVARFALGQQVYSVESVPNTKVASNQLVSDPEKILRTETVDVLNRKLAALESSTTAQVAVVVLPSIGQDDIFTFAQALFMKWGIGQGSKDNGLLILLVMDQRTVRFHTGQGLEGMLPDVICKRIQERKMVPYFREGQNDEALTAGVDEVIKILTDPAYAAEISADTADPSAWEVLYPTLLTLGGIALLMVFLVNRRKFSDSPKPITTPYREMRLSRMQWLTEFGLVPAGILVGLNYSSLDEPILPALASLYGYFMVTLLHKRQRMNAVTKRLLKEKKYRRIVEFFEDYRIGWLVWAIFYPLPFLPHYFQYKHKMVFYRNHPRDCEKCGKPLQKLDEQADDAYLTKQQAFEESLKSMDYDVWLCDACGTTIQLVYPNTSTAYEGCPKCKTRAYYLKSDVTLVSATTSSSGRGQKTHECKFCGHMVVSTYTIARISDSSSGGGSSGSSGGSFGGGSSGGGGASSSW